MVKFQMQRQDNAVVIKRQGRGNFKPVILPMANVGVACNKARELASILDLNQIEENKWESNNG